MINEHTPDSNFQSKDKAFKAELQAVFLYLKDHTATATMVAHGTGISQKNICRHKRNLEKSGKLWQVEKAVCKITGCRAWYLTCDPHKAPDQYKQLQMF